MRGSDIDDTIVAVSTTVGEGGIGIVRFSGAAALKIADELFVSRDGQRPSRFATYTIHYGHIVDRPETKRDVVDDGRTTGDPAPLTSFGFGAGGRRATPHHSLRSGSGQADDDIVDEALLTVMRAPKSYTREDVVEINCHGGIQAVKRVLELTIRRGARLAEPGEFTKRAFLNGRIDLAQAEAVLDTIRAKTEGSLKVAVGQLEGGLSKDVNSILEDMIGIASQVEASLDFPEEELDVAQRSGLAKKTKEVIGRLRALVDTYSGGIIFREGVLAIICGRSNVGKSSLMNLLLKRDRVIVSPVPGTTRDAVEEVINLKGVPIRLVDTAGISDTKDSIEIEGIKRSKLYIELADIAILVLDGSTGIDDADRDILRLLGDKKKLVVINKMDLAKKIDSGALAPFLKDGKAVEISVTERQNIESLEKAILDIVWSGDFVQGEGAILANARHKGLVDKAYSLMLSVDRALEGETGFELVALDLKEAMYNLGLIVGRSVSDDILDSIFEQFCIGK